MKHIYYGKPLKISHLSQNGYILYFAVFLLFILSAFVGLVLTLKHVNATESQRNLNKLQASVNAFSGLELAQAFIAGYEKRGAGWETPEMIRNLPKGTFILSASHDAGWLRVKSKGCCVKDTVSVEGVLGQVPPVFFMNALSIGQSKNDVIVADRASVLGNIGTIGGKAVLRSNGIFKGQIIDFKPIDYSDSIEENEMNACWTFFHDKQKKDSMGSISPFKPDSILRFLGNVSHQVIFVNSSISLDSALCDFNHSILYVGGNLRISKRAQIKNLKTFVQGSVEIKDSVRMEFCSITALGSVKLTDNVFFRGNIISAESLLVCGAAFVAYPSFLYLSMFKSRKTNNQMIIVQDNATVRGIIATGNFFDNAAIPRIVFLSRGRFDGIVLCPGALTPYGEINGSLYAEKIIYRQERNVYENWLREVSISYRDVSQMTIPILYKIGCVPRYLSIVRSSGCLL